jgi:hypothetical protein
MVLTVLARFINNFMHHICRLINGLLKILNTKFRVDCILFYEYNLRMYTRIIGRLRLSSYDKFMLSAYFYFQYNACLLFIITLSPP